jgi:hypothetical protein
MVTPRRMRAELEHWRERRAAFDAWVEDGSERAAATAEPGRERGTEAPSGGQRSQGGDRLGGFTGAPRRALSRQRLLRDRPGAPPSDPAAHPRVDHGGLAVGRAVGWALAGVRTDIGAPVTPRWAGLGPEHRDVRRRAVLEPASHPPQGRCATDDDIDEVLAGQVGRERAVDGLAGHVLGKWQHEAMLRLHAKEKRGRSVAQSRNATYAQPPIWGWPDDRDLRLFMDVRRHRRG